MYRLTESYLQYPNALYTPGLHYNTARRRCEGQSSTTLLYAIGRPERSRDSIFRIAFSPDGGAVIPSIGMTTGDSMWMFLRGTLQYSHTLQCFLFSSFLSVQVYQACQDK